MVYKSCKVALSGGIIKGRQMLKMVYDYYKTNEDYGHINTVEDMQLIKMANPEQNNQLVHFQDSWDEGLQGAVDEHVHGRAILWES